MWGDGWHRETELANSSAERGGKADEDARDGAMATGSQEHRRGSRSRSFCVGGRRTPGGEQWRRRKGRVFPQQAAVQDDGPAVVAPGALHIGFRKCGAKPAPASQWLIASSGAFERYPSKAQEGT